MRSLALAVAFAGLATLIGGTEAQACNARNQYCSYPLWAANAFSGRNGRLPEYAYRPNAIDDRRLTSGRKRSK